MTATNRQDSEAQLQPQQEINDTQQQPPNFAFRILQLTVSYKKSQQTGTDPVVLLLPSLFS